jgi:hypothetical protein
MITFHLEDDENIMIRINGKTVGRITTPGSSLEQNTIQICGFEDAYDLWGCGPYSEQIEDKHIHKKDIELQFKEYDNSHSSPNGKCNGCYNLVCNCNLGVKKISISAEMPFEVKRREPSRYLE